MELREIDRELGLHMLVKRHASGWMLGAPVIAGERRVVVVSPVASAPEELHQQIEGLGQVHALLAPNHFHHLGLEPWHLRHPGAELIASAAARPRLAKKVPALTLSGLDRLALPRPWHAERPPGLKNGEVWLRARGNRSIWVVGDAFFHVPGPVAGFMGLALRATGSAPGLRIGGTWRPLHVADRHSYRQWLLTELDRDPPDVVVPLHGEPISGAGVAVRLKQLASERL